MSEIVIRQAKRDDSSAAVRLWRQLQADHEAQDPRYRMSDDAEARWSTDFRTWTRAHTSRVWVAEADGALVGLLTAHFAEPAPVYDGPPFVFVADLVTAPEWRGRGVGHRLLDVARQWAWQLGAGEIRAGVLATNPGGRRFWTREGAEDFSVTVVIPLEPGDEPADTGG